MEHTFTTNDHRTTTDTCKFWCLISKKPDLPVKYIGYTMNSSCTWEDVGNETIFRYSNLQIEEFVNNNGGWDKWTPKFIEECKWQGIQHAQQRRKELAELDKHVTLNHLKKYRTNYEEELVREMKKERAIQYYEENKLKIAERKQAYDVCGVCGATYQHGSKARHIKTVKHMKSVTNTSNV